MGDGRESQFVAQDCGSSVDPSGGIFCTRLRRSFRDRAEHVGKDKVPSRVSTFSGVVICVGAGWYLMRSCPIVDVDVASKIAIAVGMTE